MSYATGQRYRYITGLDKRGRPVYQDAKVTSPRSHWTMAHPSNSPRPSRPGPIGAPETGAPIAPVSTALAEAEIVWNHKFFRRGVWQHEVVGGKQFVPWNDPASNPLSDIDEARKWLGDPTSPEKPVLIIGFDVVEAFRRHPLLVRRAQFVGDDIGPGLIERFFGLQRLVTAAVTFNAGWSDRQEFAVNPSHALLIYAKLKQGVSGIAEQCGSSYQMLRPSQGVLFLRAIQ